MPKAYKDHVLKLEHDTLWMGDLEVKTTPERVLSGFFGLELTGTLKDYCVLLVPLPLVDTSFEQVWIDIIEPLEPNTSRCCFVLVLVD